MDAMEAIFTRRSIRKYTDKQVSKNIIEEILKAAFVTPSAADERPWHFVVISDQAVLRDLAASMEGCEMLEEATLGFLVCGDPQLEQIPGFWIQDCCACAENVLLAAHAQGIGACWIAIHSVEERVRLTREKLGIPEHVIPLALMSMGYPAEELEGEDRYDKSRVHREKW